MLQVLTWRLTGLLLLLTPALSFAQAPPLPPKAPADSLAGPPIVSAKAWAVADGKTGQFLWGGNELEPLVMASTTKIMTARLVLALAAKDARILDEIVTISAQSANTAGSGAKVQEGERFQAKDLLFGLMLPSGNDAAVALAEHFGHAFLEPKHKDATHEDRFTAFVAEMNRQAKDLKMEKTHYLDPHGNSKNTSCARDLTILAWNSMKDERFRTYVNTRRHVCEALTKDGEKRPVLWENTNKLLAIEGFEGIKTGTTTAAGACLVSTGHRGSDRLIIVVLGSSSSDGRYVDSRNLYRWAWGERTKSGN